MKLPKLAALSLLFMIVLSVFTGCNTAGDAAQTSAITGGTTEAPVVTSAPADDLVLAADGATAYTIIVAEDTPQAVFTAAYDLKSAFFDTFGTRIYVKKDTYDNADTEIVIGTNNRPESQEALSATAEGTYSVSVIGKKIVISSASNSGVIAGIRAFIAKYLSAASADNKIPGNLYISGNMPKPVDSLSSGWNNLSEFEGTADIDINYQLYMPANYDSSKEYPVLLYMHGNGSRGDDNTTHITNSSSAVLKLLAASDKYKDGVIILAPQCLKTEQWVNCDYTKGTYTLSAEMNECLAEAMQLFEYWKSELSFDESRIYLWGNSMGAFASWDLMQRNPSYFAGAVVVAGCGDISKVSTLVHENIWIHHGTVDTTVPYSGNETMYNALVASGAGDNIKFTAYPGKAHTIFQEVGENTEVVDWLFSQHR